MGFRVWKGGRFLAVTIVFVILCCGGPRVSSADEAIKIGVLVSLSGPAASVGTSTRLVAQMVADRINKQGGISKQRLELVAADAGSDPEKALEEAKRLVLEERAIAVIGPTRTDSGMKVKPFFEETAHIPIIMAVGGDSVIAGGEFGPFSWTFKTPQRTSVAVRRIYDYLQSRHQTKVALLTAEDGFGRDGLIWLERLAHEYGIRIVGEESFDPTDTDMTPQLAKIRVTQPEALVCWTIGPSGAQVAKDLKQLGLTMPLIQCHGQPDPRYIELAGAAAEGNIMPSTKLMVVDHLPDSDPQKAVIHDFIMYYKNEYHLDEKYPINTHSGYAWDAMYLLINAIRQAGTDPVLLRRIMEETRGFVGISGIYNLSPIDHNGLGLDSLVMIKVEKGKWVLAP